jgi:hypothetical protein
MRAADLAKAGELFDIDVDQVAWHLPLVALHRRFWVQVSQPAQAQPIEGSRDVGEGGLQQPGDVAEVQALMPELHGALQVKLHRRRGTGPATCRRSAG